MGGFSEWISKNHDEMLSLVKKIVKGNDDISNELYQCVVTQLLERPQKVDKVPEHQMKYYFIRVVKNNYYSKTSPYSYRLVKDRKRHVQIDEQLTKMEDTPYEEPMNYKEWVEY